MSTIEKEINKVEVTIICDRVAEKTKCGHRRVFVGEWRSDSIVEACRLGWKFHEDDVTFCPKCAKDMA